MDDDAAVREIVAEFLLEEIETLIEMREEQGAITTEDMFETVIAPLQNAAQPRRFVF